MGMGDLSTSVGYGTRSVRKRMFGLGIGSWMLHSVDFLIFFSFMI